MSTSLTVKNGIITGIDTAEGPAVINIDGKATSYANGCIYPGFTDYHGHIAALGKKLNGVALNDCRSADECVERLKSKIHQHDSWIVEYGWNN